MAWAMTPKRAPADLPLHESLLPHPDLIDVGRRALGEGGEVHDRDAIGARATRRDQLAAGVEQRPHALPVRLAARLEGDGIVDGRDYRVDRGPIGGAFPGVHRLRPFSPRLGTLVEADVPRLIGA